MSKAAQLAALIGSGQAQGDENLIINGGMQVAQRGTSHSDLSGYGLDRFAVGSSDDAAVTVSQSTTVPSGEGFKNSMKFDVTTADTSIGAAQFYQFFQKIEGQNVAHLMFGTSDAKSITLSFWCRSNKTGTYNVVFMNNAADRFNPNDFTISSANTWEKKTITVTGDQSGTWLTTNGNGMYVIWNLALGSDFDDGTNGTWGSGDYGSGNNVNWLDSTSNDFYITGVQLEVGSVATEFDHRSFGEELALCQRYFFNPLFGRTSGAIYYPIHFNQVSTGNNGLLRWQVTFPVSMRTSPSLTHSLTDAKFQTSAPNGTDNWAFYKQNSGWASKVGNSDISVLNIAPSVNQANVGAYYVTPSDTLATAIGIGGGATFNFSSEL